jgi:hypothetical protein
VVDNGAVSYEYAYQPCRLANAEYPVYQKLCIKEAFAWQLTFSVTPASETNLTNPDEVHGTIRSLKVGKSPSRIGVPNWHLKHIFERAVTLLVMIFNMVFRTLHFP